MNADDIRVLHYEIKRMLHEELRLHVEREGDILRLYLYLDCDEKKAVWPQLPRSYAFCSVDVNIYTEPDE